MRCWTCGIETESLCYTCPSCQEIKALTGIKESFQVSSLTTNKHLDQLHRAQTEAFRRLEGTLSRGFSQLANVLEWGFDRLSWDINQQTDVLKCIDHTLKTPSETQANEYRQMGEELARRNVLDESIEFYQKALNLNRLDYRIYIGLADVQLQLGLFEEATTTLERSLSHAPKGSKTINNKSEGGLFQMPAIADWRSYSLRLLAHIVFSQNKLPAAIQLLDKALNLSPDYPEALYDRAICAAMVKDASACELNLRAAISLRPFYWLLAKRQAGFRNVQDTVKTILVDFRIEAASNANKIIEQTVDPRLEHAIERRQMCQDFLSNADVIYKHFLGPQLRRIDRLCDDLLDSESALESQKLAFQKQLRQEKDLLHILELTEMMRRDLLKAADASIKLSEKVEPLLFETSTMRSNQIGYSIGLIVLCLCAVLVLCFVI